MTTYTTKRVLLQCAAMSRRQLNAPPPILPDIQDRTLAAEINLVNPG